MSKPLITLSPNSTIKDALQTMQQKNIRRIPIVDRATMQGIITDKDVFRAILNNKISLDLSIILINKPPKENPTATGAHEGIPVIVSRC